MKTVVLGTMPPSSSGSMKSNLSTQRNTNNQQPVSFQQVMTQHQQTSQTKAKGVKTTEGSSNEKVSSSTPKELEKGTPSKKVPLENLIQQVTQLLNTLENDSSLQENPALEPTVTHLVAQLKEFLNNPRVGTGMSSLKEDMSALASLVNKDSTSSLSESATSDMMAVLQSMQVMLPSDQTSITGQEKGSLPLTSQPVGQVLSQSQLNTSAVPPVNLEKTETVPTSLETTSIVSMKSDDVTSQGENQAGNQKKDNEADPNNQNILDVFGTGRNMGKVQQFLFHKETGLTQTPLTPDQQIANQIKAWASQGLLKTNNGQLSIQLQLNPEQLGSIDLQVQQTENGLTAIITAQSSTTKDVLHSQLTQLQQTLAGSGITLHKIDINLQPPAQSQGSESAYQQPQQDAGHEQPGDKQQSSGQDNFSDGQDSFNDWLTNEVI